MVVIVDYGMGNLRSVYNKFRKMGVPAMISSNHEEIQKAEKLILPGVGHFAHGMKHLIETGLIELLNRKVLIEKTPILGICLGMQLFTKHSQEGNVEGLGWIDAETVKFNFEPKSVDYKLKIPHMGWNSTQQKKESKLLKGIAENTLYYFVHSYHVVCNNEKDILLSTDYSYTFTSGVQNENIFGTQFHPEKSHEEGMQLLKNFIQI